MVYNERKVKIIVAVIFVIGLMQMTGDLLHIAPLKGLAAATGISPAPKVFTAIRGFETYSNRFFIEYTDKAGNAQSIEVTPEAYSHVSGPYWWRNVVGAVLA